MIVSGFLTSARSFMSDFIFSFFFFQAEDGIRDLIVTGVQTCALPIFTRSRLVALGWWWRRLVFGPEQPLLGGRGSARSHHERASDRPVRPRDGVSRAQAGPLLHTGPLQCDRRSRSVPVAAERLGTADGWRCWVTASTSVWHAPSSAPNRMARRCLAVARLGREQRDRARRIDHE